MTTHDTAPLHPDAGPGRAQGTLTTEGKRNKVKGKRG
jgi:hypothetical protein